MLRILFGKYRIRFSFKDLLNLFFMYCSMIFIFYYIRALCAMRRQLGANIITIYCMHCETNKNKKNKGKFLREGSW